MPDDDGTPTVFRRGVDLQPGEFVAIPTHARAGARGVDFLVRVYDERGRRLVNDNGKGKLQSVSQEPFAEILDTSATQSRTGLGGLAQAGTTISVEPHISESDYMQLSYSIELSNFTGNGSAGLPPPSQKNSIDSTVTIPDGNTIVVGGLRVKNFREAKDTIPFIGKIPVVELLFGTRSTAKQDVTLFVFIRPVILRDDRFGDLKFLSEKAMRDVDVSGQYPKSSPIPIR